MKPLSKMTKPELRAELKELRKQTDEHWELRKLVKELLEIREDEQDTWEKIEKLAGGYFDARLK